MSSETKTLLQIEAEVIGNEPGSFQVETRIQVEGNVNIISDIIRVAQEKIFVDIFRRDLEELENVNPEEDNSIEGVEQSLNELFSLFDEEDTKNEINYIQRLVQELKGKSSPDSKRKSALRRLAQLKQLFQISDEKADELLERNDIHI